MKWQIFCLAFVGIVCSSVIAADNSSDIYVSSDGKVLKGPPIVIQTKIQDYDKPSVNDYVQCQKNLDNCLEVCAKHENPKKCEAACPVCPILMQQPDPVIQGINDTDYHAPAAKPINATNIIRVINDIRNIIDNNFGDIALRNENNIQVHQNVSRTGGKFGLGYNQRGPCCHVVYRPSKSTRPKRSRFCGAKCKSRTMIAKTMTHCDDDTDESTCRPHVTYMPYRHKRLVGAPNSNPSSPCHSIRSWPFVSCQGRRSMPQATQCHRCMQLPYGYILHYGIPLNCGPCYGEMRQQSYTPYTPYVPYGLGGAPQYSYPFVGGNSYDGMDYYDNDYEPNYNDWTLEETKCRSEDGKVVPCPKDDFASDSKSKPIQEEDNDFTEDQMFDENDYADLEEENEDLHRNRRDTFKRSIYSRRNRQQPN